MLISSNDYKTKSVRYLRQLWEEQEFTDVTLVTSDNKQIHSHKFIIYQSSKLFQAILENSRDKNPLLYLMGVDSSLLEKLLEYIYLGECELEDEQLLEFLELGKTLKFFDEEKSNDTVRHLKEQPVAVQFNVVDQIGTEKQDDEKILNETETNLSLNRPPEIQTVIKNIAERPDITQEVDENKSTQRTETEIISCSKCDFQTDTQASMEDHKNIHLGKMYICDNCPYQSDVKENLRKHFTIHLIKQRCTFCEYATSHKTRLQEHVDKRHNNENDKLVHTEVIHSCNQCPYKNASKENLRGHLTIHGPKYNCEECDYTGKIKPLRIHKQRMHENLSTKYNCEECDYTSYRKYELKQHVNVLHKGVKLPCNECDYQVGNSNALKRHKAVEHEGVTHSCTHCEFSTKSKGILKRHIEKVHEGVTYSCAQCEYKGKSKISMKYHEKTKHENVSFDCDQCDYQASIAANLQRHKDGKHKNVKHHCDQCPYQGYTLQNLNRHKKSFHLI